MIIWKKPKYFEFLNSNEIKRERKKIFFNSLIAGFIGALISLSLVYMLLPLTFSGKSQDVKNIDMLVYEFYEQFGNEFKEDTLLRTVSDYCSEREDKIECVFYNIPYKWDDNRGDAPLFKTPYSYFQEGGVCRDISILRWATLKNLDISCEFIFKTENHVYLECEEDGKIYELNNQYLYSENGREYRKYK